MAVSGALTSDAVARRDNVEGWPLLKIGPDAADNIVTLHMGRNDTASGGLTSQQAHEAIVDYCNSLNVGAIARGWNPCQLANIACGSGIVTTGLHELI